MTNNPEYHKCLECGLYYHNDVIDQILGSRCDIKDKQRLYCIKCKDSMKTNKLFRTDDKPSENEKFNQRQLSVEKNVTDLFIKLTSDDTKVAP